MSIEYVMLCFTFSGVTVVKWCVELLKRTPAVIQVVWCAICDVCS